jgi:hypothetical protein
MSRLEFWASRWPLVMVAALLVLSSSGCVGLAAQLMYVIGGPPKVKAEYAGLKGKRVAVVCVSNASAYGTGSEAKTIATLVGAILQREVKKIEVIPQSEISNWQDANDWNLADYREVGKGVDADMVVAIDLSSISDYEGQTLYKGRASFKLRVYDMAEAGDVVFSRDGSDFQYPVHGGRPASDMQEPAFKKLFISMLAQDIARTFYDYAMVEKFGADAQGLE